MNIAQINLRIKHVKICILACIFSFTFCCVFYNSKATSTGNVYVSSSKNIIEKGEEIEVTVWIENAKTAAYNINLNFDNTKLEYVSGPENTNIVGNKIISVWYDQAGGSDAKDGEIAKYVFRAKEEGEADLYIQGEFYDSLGNLIETSFKETQVQVGKEEKNLNNENQGEQINLDNNVEVTNKEANKDVNNLDIDNKQTEMVNTNLEILAIENVLLYPPFDTNITHYDIEVSNETNKLNILAIPENEMASVQIIGNNDLKEGENLIKVTVTAQNGLDKKTFEINCYKRNKEEEILNQEEKEENRKKLEEIYKVEKISRQMEEAENATKKENTKKIMWVLIITVALSLILFWIIWKIKK